MSPDTSLEIRYATPVTDLFLFLSDYVTEFDLVQVVAGVTLGDGMHLVAGGTSSVNAKISIWEKKVRLARCAGVLCS
jgi:hypothetical protein